MLIEFFFTLRALGVRSSPTEWMALMAGLKKGLHNNSLNGFYLLSRSLLVKDEGDFDAFDRAFLSFFSKGGEIPSEIDEFLLWLSNSSVRLEMDDGELALLNGLDPAELMGAFERLLKEQRGRHSCGDHFIGDQGTSPFGKHGKNPSGLSLDEEGGQGGAVLLAARRDYKNLSRERTLDTRKLSLALKRLKVLRRLGEEKLDLDSTVERTAREGGEIELVFGQEVKNDLRIIMALDVGGSMDEHIELCEKLFSAAYSIKYFREFRHYWFHNCVYDFLYTDVETGEGIAVEELIRQTRGENYRLLMVGDALMAPFELMIPNGFLERKRNTMIKGIDRLKSLAKAFPKSAWLNPLDETGWGAHGTIRTIGSIFPMYPLTVEGIAVAARSLAKV